MNPAPPLAPTLAPLGGDPRAAIKRVASMGFRFVQLSATQPGLRPRELDRSARRDLAARLRRSELACSGLDLWIPVEHFLDPARCDRAVEAVTNAIGLAADLGRCPVSLTLPVSESSDEDDTPASMFESIFAQADRDGVALADHALPLAKRPGAGVGVDPAAWLAGGDDPAQAVMQAGERLVSARLVDQLTSGLRGPIGDMQEGRLDVTAYGVSLSVAGFTRPVVVDARQWLHPWEGLGQTASAWVAALSGGP